MQNIDVVIIGAGAAGLMCAITAAQKGRSVVIYDHANKVGKKILMSGGGSCNFTNLNISKENYISKTKNFTLSAFSNYTAQDFLSLVKKHKVQYTEKKHGQLFCRDKAKDIVNMLLAECEACGVKIYLKTNILSIQKNDKAQYRVKTNDHLIECESLVCATGGLSIPTIGSSPFGYKLAEQFNLKVNTLSAALVPFTYNQNQKEKLSEISGVSCYARVSTSKISFTEDILFTHRGLSGPAILQISSYWDNNHSIKIDFMPNLNIKEILINLKDNKDKRILKNVLTEHLPKRLIPKLLTKSVLNKKILELAKSDLNNITEIVHNYIFTPNGTEGYRTAEVTKGGLCASQLSSKTMECKSHKGLYFIGEVVDVTGWLGGFNFQWAWSSGYTAGLYV